MATNTFVELEHIPEAEPLAAYTGIDFDLRTAREFAQTLLNQRAQGDWSNSDAFTTAAIVRYSRPFASGVRRRLEETALNKLTPEQRAHHEFLLAVRDKHVAHSVNAFEDNQPVARYWVERVTEDGIEQISCIHQRVTGLSTPDLQQLVELTTVLLAYIAERMAEERGTVLYLLRQMPLDLVLKGRPFKPLDTSDPTKRRRF